MSKRMLSILLTLALLVSLFPAALAEDIELEPAAEPETTEEPAGADALDIPHVGDGALDVPEEDIAVVDPETTVPAEEPNEIVASGTCGENLTWTLDDAGTLIVSGSGKMDNYYAEHPYYEYAPWHDQEISTVILQPGVTSIGTYAFYRCRSLKSIQIPGSVTRIGYYSFWDTGLTSLTLPSGVRSVETYAFTSCWDLTSVSISETVTLICRCAFGDCKNLKDVYYSGYEDAVSHYKESEWFASWDAEFPYARWDKEGNDELFQAAWHCKPLEEDWSVCGSCLAWKLSNGTLTIKGTGRMWEFMDKESMQNSAQPWEDDLTEIRKIVLEPGLTSIGNGAFANCTALTEISIPDGVTEIGSFAFYECARLTAIPLPNSVRNIYTAAFANCRRLAAVTLPEGLETLYESMFSRCLSLSNIEIPGSVKTVETLAFDACRNLKTIRFRGAPPQIKADSFLDVEAIAYYPAGMGWTENDRQDYGGLLDWVKYEPVPVLSPAGLSVKGIALHWDGSNAEEFELQRSTGGSWKSLKKLPDTEFTDSSVQMGKTYSYRVRAYAGGAWTEYSEPLEVFFNPFADVSGAKTVEYVAWAFNNGVVNGTSSTKFSPDNPCTRIQFVMMLWKMHGSPDVGGTNPFSDISGTKTTKAILWALKAGIINSGKTFNPDGNITRVNIVMMLWKLAGSPEVGGKNPFTDVSGTKTTKAVLWAYQNGITKGTSATKFSPDKDCTRVQLVIFLYKYNGIYHVI